MSTLLKFSIGLISIIIFSIDVSADIAGLTLEQAVTIALSQDDPSVASLKSQARSLQESAIADGQLPDPKVKFGVVNLATDSFRFSQEPMTNLQFGAHQNFISSSKRKFARQRTQDQGQAFLYQARGRQLIIALEVRKLWLKLFYLGQAEILVGKKQQQLQNMQKAQERKFANSTSSAHIILSIDSELALLTDKLEDIAGKKDYTRALIARYIGEENARKSLVGSFDTLPSPKPAQILTEGLVDHPVIQREQALIQASSKDIALAKEAYKPNWGIGVGYGLRAGGRADVATALVTMDVPLFTGKRQDKRLSAAKQSKQAAELRLQSQHMNMVRDIKASFTIWLKSSSRIDLYNRVILKRTQDATKASENAFAGGKSDFTEIIRTHLSELEARIKLETIKWERANAAADLLYFQGAE